MTHFSNDPAHVRCEIHKPGGKWYATAVINMRPYYHHTDLREAIRECFRETQDALINGDPDRWILVVPDPYHVHAHPQVIVPEWMFKAVRKAEDERNASEKCQ